MIRSDAARDAADSNYYAGDLQGVCVSVHLSVCACVCMYAVEVTDGDNTKTDTQK